MQLDALHGRLEEADLALSGQTYGEAPEIDHLAHDSRILGPGGLFVAIRGEEVNGHLFIDRAVEKGAAAVVCEYVPEDSGAQFTDVPFVQVHDSRQALAELAAAFFGDPARQLQLLGVTGTNGKTTTAFLIHHLLMALGENAGLVGTVAVRIGEEEVGTTHTTPDAIQLHRLFRRMVETGCTSCVMEVSSHALVQERTRGISFDVAVFTNFSQDHLDYHPSLEAYFEAKKRLFDGLCENAVALYNQDDEAGPRMVADTSAGHRSYGQTEDADLRFEVLDNSLDGLRLRLDGREQTFQLVGGFNAYNLAAAYGAGRALGYGREEVLTALSTAPPVPGRFEQLRFADGTTVIIDYAHTPDALQNVLETIRAIKPEEATLWCVFGCGGDRDPSKRRTMGSIAERYADRVIVTSDNPRTEDPPSIMNDIRRGMNRPVSAQWIVDRREAIQDVARQRRPGDVVLVAGKGHETYQIIGEEKRPFDDREEVQKNFDRQQLEHES